MRAKWPETLNEHAGVDYYVLNWAPDGTTLWYAFVGTTLDNAGFILDVHMDPHIGRLEGYPENIEYWHYVTGIGYYNYYGSTHYGYYFDPYDGRSGTFGEHMMTINELVPLLQDRGIVW